MATNSVTQAQAFLEPFSGRCLVCRWPHGEDGHGCQPPRYCSFVGKQAGVPAMVQIPATLLADLCDEIDAREWGAMRDDRDMFMEQLRRVIAGLEVALVEPHRARSIVEDLHDECVRVYNGEAPRELEAADD